MPFDITKKFTVQIEGRGDIHVSPADHVASGGEGHVYRPSAGSLAVKVWDEPTRATTGRMTEKIKMLSALKHPAIVAPEALCRNARGSIIGYIMPWVTGWDLPLAFTNDWRSAHGFGDAEALAFVDQMRDVTAFVHGHDIVMGDANELNILGDKGAPRYIDVDPWLPPGYRGDKIMPTIQDHHAAPFSREADWFAWAVVTFQLLTGTHPYRGTHPDFKRSDLEGRMKANASVFDPKTRLNAAVRPWSFVPSALVDWYEAAFQRGERGVPPAVGATRVPVRVKATAPMMTGALKITKAFTLSAPFARVVGPDLIMLADGALLSLPDGRRVGTGDRRAVYGGGVEAIVVHDRIYFRIGVASPQDSNIAASRVWSAAGRLFGVTNDGIRELLLKDLGQHAALLPGRKWSLNPNATTFGDGAALFDALGAKYLVVPQPGLSVAMVRVRELDGLKPVSIIGRGRTIVMSLIDRSGTYSRATIVLDEALSGYQITSAPADDGALTDAILNNGLILWITASGDLGLSTGTTFSLGGITGGKLIAGPSGVFYVAVADVFRLSMS